MHPSFIYPIYSFIHPSTFHPSTHPSIHLPSIHSSIIHSSLIVCISHLQIDRNSEHLPWTHLLSYPLGRLCPSPQWQMSGSLPPRPRWCCGGRAEEACHSSSGHLEWFHPGCPLGSDPERQSESMGRMGLYLGTSRKELEKNKDTQSGCLRLSLRVETWCLLHGVDPTFSLFLLNIQGHQPWGQTQAHIPTSPDWIHIFIIAFNLVVSKDPIAPSTSMLS